MYTRRLIAAVAATLLPLTLLAAPPILFLADTEDPSTRKVYIVQLKTPSVAEYVATMTPMPQSTTAVKGTRPRFDKTTAAAQNHLAKIQDQQQQVLARAGSDVEQVYSYAFGLNGFAAVMSPGQAHKLRHLPEVQAVWEDEIRPLATRHSPTFLGLFDSDGGLFSDLGLDGDGVVIGFIDSGVYPEHPALSDTQEASRPRACRSAWAESSLLGRWLCGRFRRMDDVLLFEPPENWNGACVSGERFEQDDCNNKLIGARWFIDGALASGLIDEDEIRSARDVDGHGTHTATTAAGNRRTASIFGTRIGTVRGMAPGARVAVYKACWLRPGQQRASCNTSDLAMAIDAAVADGVDIINYSVGSSAIEVSAPDDAALLAATKAGVLAVVAAGNDGPGLGTIGSPAGGPWVITAAASSRDGEFSREAMQIQSPPSIAGRYAVKEANFTPRLEDNDPIEAPLVLADDDTDTASDACEELVNDNEIDGNIALIQRGGCDFDIKIRNAGNAGAIAALVYNIAGPPIVMNGDAALVDIPALMVGQSDGNLFIAELDAGNTVNAVLESSFLLTEPETGNVMANFSARGPGPVRDIMKPDVVAPGVNIIAGFSPDVVNSTPDETWAYLSGTSMATPHVAGIAALIRQQHPNWSPAAIKSALMTTSRQDMVDEDGNQANPFEMGTGHIVPNSAVDPGLVFDLGDDDYDAFACGQNLDTVTQQRCDDLEAAGASFDPSDMNQPNISVSRFVTSTTVTRSVTNVSDQAETYTPTIFRPIDFQVAVDPPSLTIAPGETANFDVTVSFDGGNLDLWRFGSITWDSGQHSVRSTLAVKPVTLTAPFEINSFGGTGSFDIPIEFGYDGSYEARVHGLNEPEIQSGFVDNDPTKTFDFRNGNGVTQHRFDVPANQLFLRFALFDRFTDGDDDLDMYVYYCGTNNTGCVQIGQSGEPTSEEEFNLFRPEAGVYGVLIHGFQTDQVAGGAGANYDLYHWRFGEIDDPGNMTVSGPALVSPGQMDVLTIDWANLGANTIYLGGISHNTPNGLFGVTLVTIEN